EDERTEFITALVREATLVEITDTVTECRDPKDDKFLELAVSGKATCIVSGDDDLLVLHPFRGIPVLTPRQFLAIP
ncbi:MAG: putative toxin-antitoxin system toxin component, PIN family, partial [Nitrospirae bacterium]|nr:putative toxin-antitoxin system toxin component, PIN family [Nitrospirota bacterium]